MPDVVTVTDLQNAKEDANDLSSLTNGFSSVVTRTGGTKQSYSQYMSNITHGDITAYDPTATYTLITEWVSYVDTSVSPQATTVYRPIPSALPISQVSPEDTAPNVNKWLVAKGWGAGDGIIPPVETYSELDNLPLAGYPDGTAITVTGSAIAGTWVVGTDSASPQAKLGNVGTVRRNLNDSNRYVERIDALPLRPAWFTNLYDCLVVADANGYEVLLSEDGDLLTQAFVVTNNPITIRGFGNQIQNTGVNDDRGSRIIKGFNGDMIEVTGALPCTFRDFGIDGDKANYTGRGLVLTLCGRTKLDNIGVKNCADHNIEYVNGNLTAFHNIITVGSGGDGLRVNDPTGLPDANACTFQNIDARGNTGVGFNVVNGWNVIGQGIVCQDNTGAGLRLDNCRQSHIVAYTESNATNLDLELTNNANCEGNLIYLVYYNGITDNSAGENMIWKSLDGAETIAAFDNMRARKWQMPTNIGVSGTWEMDHPVNATYRWFFAGTAQLQKIRFKNVAGLSTPDTDEPLYPAVLDFEGGVIERARYVLPDGDTTPNVSTSEFWLANNTGAITITAFDGGQPGQKIVIIANNTNTTIQHLDNTINTKTGANVNLALREAITFIRNGSGGWVEI